jgi:hypothetical protein
MRKLTLLALLASACAMGSASPASSGPLKPVTFDSGPQCLSLCTELGLKMSALVILEGKTACVCQPPGTPVPSAGAVSAATSVINTQTEEEKKKAAISPNLMQEQQLQEEQDKAKHPH